MFRKNIGRADRIARAAVGIILVALGLTMEGVVATIVLVLGLVLLFTSATGYCTLYKLLGFSTLKEE